MKNAKFWFSGKFFRWVSFGGLALAAVLLMSGWRGKAGESVDFRSATCFDVVAADGAIHLLFGIPDGAAEERLRFYYTRSVDAGETWSEATEVATDHALPGRHGRGNDPQLAVAGRNVMAIWTARGGGPFGSGPLGAAVSLDGGKTWRESAAPANAGAGGTIGFRFPDLAASGRAFHAAWIHAEGEERSLRHARLDFGKEKWTTPAIVDEDICACCWNTVKARENGTIYVLYRDQEPSDMALAISRDEGKSWERRGAVGEFDWHFNGCPHVGGGLSFGPKNANGEPTLVASVWTGNGEVSGAYLFRSVDGGRSWGNRRDMESNSPGRNTDVATGGNGDVFAVWDEAGDGVTRMVFAASSSDGGKTWGKAERISAVDAFATHPRIVASGEGAVMFWTGENAEGSPRLFVQGMRGNASEKISLDH